MERREEGMSNTTGKKKLGDDKFNPKEQ